MIVFSQACQKYIVFVSHIGITLSGVCLCVRLSGSHTFLVVTHSYVSQVTHAFLGKQPLCYNDFVGFSIFTLFPFLYCHGVSPKQKRAGKSWATWCNYRRKWSRNYVNLEKEHEEYFQAWYVCCRCKENLSCKVHVNHCALLPPVLYPSSIHQSLNFSYFLLPLWNWCRNFNENLKGSKYLTSSQIYCMSDVHVHAGGW